MKWDLCSLKAPFPQLMPDLTVGIFNVSKSEMKLPFLHLERKCYREKWKVERLLTNERKRVQKLLKRPFGVSE